MLKCMKIIALQLVFFIGLSTTAVAQLPSTGVSSSGVLDGVYVQEHIPTKRVIQYPHLREADVMWSKRVWRTIDLREKMNHPLYYPEEPLADRMSLFDVIIYGVFEEGSLTIYDLTADFDDKFRFPVKPLNGNINAPAFRKRLDEFFGTVAQVARLDPETDEFVYDDAGDQIYDSVAEPYTSRDIIRYEIKEDWFFDKQRSVMDVRIIGISPVVYFRNEETGDIMGPKNLFWLYFPECRYVFQNFFVYNTSNDAMRMSFDDLFWKRQFSSYIHKETNVFDRTVNPSWDGLDALLESEKIKQEMFKIEHDVWHL
jgi:gliding motility associated protien GldN